METKTLTITLTVKHDASTEEALFQAVGHALLGQDHGFSGDGEPETNFFIEQVEVNGQEIYSLSPTPAA